MLKVKSYLPVFSGFYESCFDGSDSAIEYLHEDLYHELKYSKDEIDFILDKAFSSNTFSDSWQDYKQKTCVNCCNFLEDKFQELGLVTSITYDSLYSPKEYNFSTDSINCTYELDESNIEKIKEYITNNFDLWTKYIKDHFTSRDGFWSYHSNNSSDEAWQLDTVIQDTTKLGVLLEFVCELEDITDFNMYEYHIDNDGNMFIHTDSLIDEISEELKEKNITIKKIN